MEVTFLVRYSVTVGRCRENTGGTNNHKPSLLTKHRRESNMGTGANAQTQRVDLTKKHEADYPLYTRLNEG